MGLRRTLAFKKTRTSALTQITTICVVELFAAALCLSFVLAVYNVLIIET